ncbi:MAG: hypothetical protein JO267_02955 [Alphaproteobacteria bacterium]|nr:hypothetical protein [Alphaproteobacteria bacterium]
MTGCETRSGGPTTRRSASAWACILGRIRELHEAFATSAGIVRLVLATLLYVLLLVHQVGELSDHAARRRRRALRDL